MIFWKLTVSSLRCLNQNLWPCSSNNMGYIVFLRKCEINGLFQLWKLSIGKGHGISAIVTRRSLYRKSRARETISRPPFYYRLLVWETGFTLASKKINTHQDLLPVAEHLRGGPQCSHRWPLDLWGHTGAPVAAQVRSDNADELQVSTSLWCFQMKLDILWKMQQGKCSYRDRKVGGAYRSLLHQL